MDGAIANRPRGSIVRDLLADIPVIDADTHISEWDDLWTSRAPAKFKDRVPQLREVDGRRVWHIDGMNLKKEGVSSAIRKDGSKVVGMAFQKLDLPDVHAGSHDLKARLAYMDQEGIYAQIAYSNVLGFGGQKAMGVDSELRLVSSTILNDAMAEMQAESGDRILPMAMMPWWDVRLAAAEAERCARMGMRGINMNSDPHLHGLPPLGDPYWNPLWDVCCDRSLPVNFHIGASDESMTWLGTGLWPGQPDNIQLAYGSLMLFIGNLRVLTNILISRFLENYPTLKIVSVESGAGWAPFMLEGLEYQLTEGGVQWRDLPTEVFRRQIYACTWFERRNIVDTIRKIGADNVMFETDFPHPTCLYPEPLDYMQEAVIAMTETERSKLFGGNAARVYNIQPPTA